MSFFTFSEANPEFKGSYVAMAVGEIATMKLFDCRQMMMNYVRYLIEEQGYESVSTTVLDKYGEVDNKLLSKETVYYVDIENESDEDPIIEGTNIRVEFYSENREQTGRPEPVQ